MKNVNKVLITLFLGMAISSCSSSSYRQPSAEATANGQEVKSETAQPYYHSDRTEQIFKNIMSEPTDGEKSQRYEHYIDRQRGVYYAAQNLLRKFDAELDKMYKLKLKKGTLTKDDKEPFFRMRFEMNIAWAFSERNLHELQDIYQTVLECANNPQHPNNVPCNWILSNTDKRLAKVWKLGQERASIISLAQELEVVHSNVLAVNPNARIPNLNTYSNPPKSIATKAYQDTARFLKSRKVTTLDTFINSEWEKFKNENNNSDLYDALYNDEEKREPNALDTLYPAADGNGHVTGNRFPKGHWAMTFDDGPHPTHTQGMFNALKEAKIIGTFFWLSQNIKLYPQLVKDAKDKYGYFRASHSYTHANLPKLNDADLRHEIFEASDDFAKVVGEKPTLFRCPYGACNGNNSTIRKYIAQLNMLEIFWNVDTLDWQDKNPESIFDRAKKQMDSLDHGIVLFHDVHPQSVEATKLVLKYINNHPGWKAVPLSVAIGLSRDKEYYSP